jgi:transcriptional regulator with GAF, ATPase, and Fis domain
MSRNPSVPPGGLPADPAARTSLLFDLLKDATRRTDVAGVLHVLLRGGREALGAQEGLVAQGNLEKASLDILARSGGRLRDREDLLSLSRPPVARLLDLGKIERREGEDDIFFRGCRVQLLAPLSLGERGSATLVLESASATAFGTGEVAFFEEFLEQTRPVLASASLAESRRREIQALWDVRRGMLSQDDLDVAELNTLLGKILQLALARTRSANGVILMADEKTGELVTSSQAVMGDLAFDLPEKFRRRQRGRPSGIVFWVLDNNKPYLSNNIENDPNYIPLFAGIRSHLSVPISFQDRCIGVIVVESPQANAYSQEDQAALEDLSRNVTILVRRAQLFEATRALPGRRGVVIRGLSPEWEEVERRVERAANTNATVILRGESGTGKELLAHAIHFNSKRRDRPLVVVNTAAIPDELLESTLFGHVKGAFTGASYDRVGEFEKAHSGSIFLDEIGDLGLPLQVKLLRVLQSGEIQKIGSNEQARAVDVRVIAATSRNLEEMMQKGLFREDLYYRLHVVPIWLPPLRQYRKSIPSMVKAFLSEFAKEHERPVRAMSDEAMELLLRHDFPGNVRELRNIVEQAVIMARRDTIGVEDLPVRLVEALHKKAPVAAGADYKSRRQEVLARFEREYLAEVLGRSRGNISRAAAIAGINRVNFYKLVRRHKLDPASFR